MKNKRDRLFFTQLFVPQASQSSYDRRAELDVRLAIPSAQSACGMEIFMDFFNALIHNTVFMSAVTGWFAAQVIKTVIYTCITKSFDPERLVGSGGMPSSHSAFVCACASAMGAMYGWTSPTFTLAAVVAIASSYLDKPVPDHMAAIGEVGLSGEIRSISHLEQRLTEVHRLGFTQCMIPARRARELKPLPGLELLPVQNIAQALRLLVREK